MSPNYKPVWKKGLSDSHYHIYNQYVITTYQRDELRAFLLDKGISTEIYYPVPLHIQECFTDLGYQPGSYLMSEEAAKRTLALSIYPKLTLEQQEYVVDSIREFFV